MLLENKTALITGSSRGIGESIARLFASQGATIILNARRPGTLEGLKQELIAQYGTSVHSLYFDVSDYDQVKKSFRELFKITKRLDVLVNNAGIFKTALLGMVTREQIEQVFSVNTFGILYTSQYAVKLMARNNSGSIINLSSIIATSGYEGHAVYGGSKAAVIGITKSLARELGGSGIRVNAIAPGFIDTEMTRDFPAEKIQERLNSIKMGRLGTAADVAGVALMLAADSSSYVTGQVVGVDGGMVI